MCKLKYLLFFFLFGTSFSSPVNEFGASVNEGELSMDDIPLSARRPIIPGGYSPQKVNIQKTIQLSDLIDQDNDNLKKFQGFIGKGITAKGMTFNIYDDQMRESAITLFRLMKNLEMGLFQAVKEWAYFNINKDMFDYTMLLLTVHSDKLNPEDIVPPFINKPNFFVTSETIFKATRLKANEGIFEADEAKVNHYFKKDGVIYINTNYSEWNERSNSCDDHLNYFREDIELNSYYYGIHLLHPFFMSNNELYEINPRNAEHYYYAHQQLMARYLLEFEHLDAVSRECQKSTYNPQLIYDNGLPFPRREPFEEHWNDGQAYLKIVDIAISECISRGVLIMNNGTTVNISEDDHMNLLAKLIRANLDSTKAAKIIRNLYAYGGKIFNIDSYDPSPSVLHHAQTSLRDPLYWKLINDLLKYFTDYKRTLKPLSLTDFEYEDLKILDAIINDVNTHFDNYDFDISNSLNTADSEYLRSPVMIAARQRRLSHDPFDFEFKIESKEEKKAVVTLFIGPKCDGQECFEMFTMFYELDAFEVQLNKGINNVRWTPTDSPRYSHEYQFANVKDLKTTTSKYNMFKFPERLIIPHGTEEGLKLKLFVIITPSNKDSGNDYTRLSPLYDYAYQEISSQPLGFPFNRLSKGFNPDASNYKLYDLTIYHKKKQTITNTYFSSHLY